MHRTNRTAAALAALVAGLVLTGCGGDDEPASPATTAPTATAEEPATTAEPVPPTTAAEPDVTEVAIEVRGGRPDGGIARPKVEQGDLVVFVITADAPDEAHLHGYDLDATIGPGQTGRIELTASIPGRFELELHEAGTQLAELTVEP